MFHFYIIRGLLIIFQVVRCFEDNDIVHVNGKVDPKIDIDVINLELAFSDLDQVSYYSLLCTFLTKLGACQISNHVASF